MDEERRTAMACVIRSGKVGRADALPRACSSTTTTCDAETELRRGDVETTLNLAIAIFAERYPNKQTQCEQGTSTYS